MAQQLQIPILLLPGKSSVEMGRALGTKTIAVLLFLPTTTTSTIATQEEEKDEQEVKILSKQMDRCQKGINSFIEFALSKVPSPPAVTA
eukprot:14579046-Ditylum_brightwellii.AAC.1